MQTIKFFRIHDNLNIGKGCYYSDRHSLSVQRCGDYEEDLSRHPIPEDDSKLLRSFEKLTDEQRFECLRIATISDYHFGFKSIDQFRAWFYDDNVVLWLHNQNYVLTEFEVSTDNCHVGYSQMIAILSECKLVKSYSLREFTNK